MHRSTDIGTLATDFHVFGIDGHFCPTASSLQRSPPERYSTDATESESLIGAGGMGSIFVAEHLKFGRDAAVKVLSNTAHGTSQAHERFTREAKAVCHLQHPNLVTYHDFEQTPTPG